MLTRLTQVFFDRCPQASIALHRPTFLAALRQPFGSPQFPHAAILHAICAVASLHEPILSSPHPIESDWPAAPGLVPTSFSEKHARWAKEFHDEACFSGVRLPEIVTSIWILSQFYFSQARWFELWASSALALRYAIPLGMHRGPTTSHPASFSSAFDTFNIADFPSSPDSLIADPIEEERRRNSFWLCYAVERFQATSPHSVTCLHDEDVTQLLPLRVVDFEVGATHMQGRQTISSRNVLTEHPAHLTDSFVLYIKSAILLSRVKNFNNRTIKYQQHGQVPPDFARMESMVTSFIDSFPPEYQRPIVDGSIDPLLLIAHIVPHVALIQMHDPYTMSQIPEMRSTDRILTASRSIFQLTCDAYSTQFDFALLDDTISLFWYIAATSLMQFWKASAQFGDVPRAGAFSSEVEIIRLAMARLGKQVSVAQRHLRMLDDRIRVEIPQYSQMSSMASPLAMSTVTSIHSHSAGTSPTDDHLSFDSHLQAAQELVGYDTAVQGIVPSDAHYDHLV